MSWRGRKRERVPRFSIVMFTKNGMPFVRDAVASLEAQTFTDYELIVQDAASTDGTKEFLAGLGLPSIRMLSEPDAGLGDAYNRAFPRCQGDIVGTLDADNLLMPHALEIVDALFRKYRQAFAIYGAAKIVDAAGREVQLFVPGEFDQLALMRCELVPPMSTTFFDRKRCGPELRGDPALTAGQDYELLLRLSDRKFVRTTTVLGATRLSDKSMTRNPENYERFCTEKIAALDGFVDRHPLLRVERDAAAAGILCWAAESILEIEGPGARFESFIARAAAILPDDDRVRRVREAAAMLVPNATE